MKLMVLTAAVFPTKEEAQKKLWIFLESAKKAGIPEGDLHMYGTGRGFPGYRTMCLDWQWEYLKVHGRAYTHVLYTDAWDAFFTGSLKGVVFKYENMGKPPILTSAYIGLGNESDMSKYVGCFDETLRYRYPNRGGYIAEIPAMIESFERMMKIDTGDDCFAWYQGWREEWFRPAIDSQCEIFQVSDYDCTVEEGGYLENTHTGTLPEILHLSGGYSHQSYGKDDTLIPWAIRLGVITQEQADESRKNRMDK